MSLKIRKRLPNFLLFFFLFLILWNFVFEKQGIIDFIKLLNQKKRIQEKIIELKGREILFLHKKNFLQTEKGLRTVLILRLGHTELVK